MSPAGTAASGHPLGPTRTGSNALGNAYSAVSMFGGPSFNTIGGTTAAARNILSGRTNRDGVFLSDPGSSNNVIQGNYIGTDISGTAPMGNNGVGVFVGTGATSNLIGGTVTGAGNVIAANVNDGLQLYGPGTRSEERRVGKER